MHGTPTRERIEVAPDTSLNMPGPRSLPEQNHKEITTTPLQQEHSQHEVRKRGILLPVARILLVCLIAIGAGVLAFRSWNSSSPFPVHTVTPAPTLSTPAPTITVSPYPRLATSYAGTVFDLLSRQKTNLFLTNVKQSGRDFQGTFQGLGQVGTFKGTVSADSSVHFTVSIWGGNETLSFDGTIKVGGDMVGEFYALDQNSNKLGDYGPWDAGPQP